MRDGWIKLHRKLQEKGFYKKPKYAHLWVHLLLEANHKPQEVMWNGKTMILKPGQFITGRKILALNSGINENSIQRMLDFFKNAHQIEQQTTNQNRLITILKWKQYQGNEQQNEQPVNNGRTTDEQQNEQRKNSQEVSSKRQIGNQQVISEQQNEQQMNNKTTKRVKKESNIKKEINKNKKEEEHIGDTKTVAVSKKIDFSKKQEKDYNARDLVAYFGKKFEETIGWEYNANFGKDGKIMKDLATQYKPEGVLDLIEEFFDMAKENEWVADKLEIGVFKSVVNKLLIRMKKEK